MAETKYTQAQVDALIAADASLERAEVDKYNDYKSKDPFPKVGEALLNSADLLMYILTVGIIEPFNVDNLKGVTYACTFSGEAHLFDSETGGMKQINLNDDKELILKQNSITYLKIKEKFRVPEYMVLRFNLSVSNAYKGVLLGTGPIVDPGFEGNLFIPLHNLTGNEYIIKKGASLIRVEFTKLSRHIDWYNKRKDLFPLLKPITKTTPQNAKFSDFIEESLLDPSKKKFYTRENSVSVRSSIPDAIAKSASKADEAHRNAQNSATEAKAATEIAENLNKKIRTWSLIGIIGVVLAVATLTFSIYTLIHDTNTRYDGIVEELKDCRQQIYTFEQEIKMLQEQQSKNNASGETVNSAPLSSNGTMESIQENHDLNDNLEVKK